jgi:hypothetical protein
MIGVRGLDTTFFSVVLLQSLDNVKKFTEGGFLKLRYDMLQ